MRIVLDKSYWRGIDASRLNSLCTDHEVIMPECLFFEVLTEANKEIRAMLFRKLPTFNNPLTLFSTHSLIAYEIENMKPVEDIAVGIIEETWAFNRGLCDPAFIISELNQRDLDEWIAETEKGVDRFVERVANLKYRYRELADWRPGMDKNRIDRLKNRIARNSTEVKQFYHDIFVDKLPRPDLIDNKWAIFRWLQVQLLAGLDYIASYGDNIAAINDKIENEYQDLEYCLTACMVDGLATLDSGLADRYQLIMRNGRVFQ